ncbi:hypothetical protein R75461_05619 [Paraburkholderia nemoris]|jgi:hypothetical protein|uniref:hypothetical protein n=1 Tax=Paraburkholderia nemoris TaxID=2793076 RepID=UPI00190E08CD|nr:MULTISPECIES: hypothetical protein [Paraburkholderia]MBK3784407.1 hypothetical protein [Paraburkholderia aspalathi]CAE6758074.1 hypothetical protein LMG22931_03465 [Paraburkholderia nemoris]CAE6810279.1 hypothetical protein R75461_05619 [Paraburkholderia nemoris]
MKNTRATLPSAAANLGAAHEAQRTADIHDEARRQAVLYRGTRFTNAQNQPLNTASTSPQARKRRARLPQSRRSRGEVHEDEPGHVRSHEEEHGAIRGQGNDGGGSSGDGDNSHSGQGGRDDARARVPEVRSVATSPVRPYAGGALPLSAARMTDPVHAEAVRTAFCEALLALRDDPSTTRVVGVAELQLDRLDAMQACQSLRTPEAMGALRQRLIDASKDSRGKKNPFNLLLPLFLLMSERPLTTTREKESRSKLTLQRDATLARGQRAQ